LQKYADNYLWQINRSNRLHSSFLKIAAVLSLIVVLSVSWWLKLTGITLAGEAFCGKDEHVHGAECPAGKLICLQAETQAHTHEEITEGHTHTDECYDVLEACPLEEHIHDESCYSDITADLETSDDWEMTMADLDRGMDTSENVVAIARSQLGYTESILNFQVDEAGIRRGITRYGQWYGNPYGDWSAMFVSFCLHYAGTEDMPANAGPESMRLEWEDAELYKAAEEYSPQIGNLIFLHNETDTEAAGDELLSRYIQDIAPANAVGILTDVTEDTITVIEGNVDNMVAETTYAIDDPAILGYGLVPNRTALMMFALAPSSGVSTIAKTTSFNTGLFTDTNCFIVYATRGGNHYAFDGSGKAVQIYIDDNGNILSDIEDPDLLLWTFTRDGNNYVIQNLSTGRYLHPFYNSNSDYGVTTSGRWSTSLIRSGNGVIFNASAYAQLNSAADGFVMTRTQGSASVFQFGIVTRCTVWLDGSNGGLMSLAGSPNRSYSAKVGDTIQLPTEWTSPEKYSYVLRGWYDVTNSQYYPPGAEVTVTGNMVFYADWIASTYDIGRYNAMVADTVSTNSFITTHLFDYSYLFNIQSANASVTATSTSHSETWSMATSGNVDYQGQNTLDFIFVDNDSGGRLSIPNNRSNHNIYPGAGIVTQGIYKPELENLLFSTNNSFDPETGTGVIGKHYLGTADHLFQLMTDPNDPHYGYYYYDSERNAASYNQSDQRFYVYEYLERTTDSAGTSDAGKYSDFLPLNAPSVNTNGRTPATYTYSGNSGEYAGTTHYMYEATNSGNSPVGTNFLFGMRTDIHFYLPNTPGSGGNKDFYGKDMHFKFSGDDDVWILIDDKLVLDIGGIHGIESGEINFTTGVVTINGVKNNALSNALISIPPGERTLTILYLERGSSQSNCAIYFNLAPRYSFQIQKEDVLTRDILNGAQFSVYMDLACTIPAQLWTSKTSHDADEPSTHVFTVENGTANMWGMSAGQTYYIKETRKPYAEGYDLPDGIIELNFDMQGFITYQVHVLEQNGNLTPGFTVHGIKVDEERQSAFIVATNIQHTPIQEPTSVTVSKVWNDSKNHSGDSVTVYLTMTDPDGTVRRIREITLSQLINWTYTWENLPKYDANGNEILYGVQEATVPGYVGKVEAVEPSASGGNGSNSGGASAETAFENGQTYLLSTRHGYLTTDRNGISFENSQQTAQNSSAAQWVATVNRNGTVTLVNKAGKTLYYDNYTFRASSSPGTNKNLSFSQNRLYCFIDHGGWSETQYPVDNDSVVSNTMYNHVLYTTNTPNQALQITPMKLGGSAPPPTVPVEGGGNFRITNTPVGNDVTSLTVRKVWDTGGYGDSSLYETLTVEMKLLANGTDAGLSCELNLKNGWSYTFRDLPLHDGSGNPIRYSVEELPLSKEWQVHYGEILSSGGSSPAYSTTVTNSYYIGGPMLPSTGSAARLTYILCGFAIMAGPLVCGFGSRRKRERRMK